MRFWGHEHASLYVQLYVQNAFAHTSSWKDPSHLIMYRVVCYRCRKTREILSQEICVEYFQNSLITVRYYLHND